MHELQIACIPLVFYLSLVIGAYIYTKYVRAKNTTKDKIKIKNVNAWIERLNK